MTNFTDKQINDLIDEATATEHYVNGEFSQIINLAMAATENALTTVYEEKAAPVEDLARLTLGSLRDLLAENTDAYAAVWFAARGVRF